MYTAHFKLREAPFDNTPDPRFYYATPAHEEALASLIHVIRQRKGAALLTGLPGCGKTFIARLALRALRANTRVVWLGGASLDPAPLLADICRGFQLDVPADMPRGEMLARLEAYFVSQFRSGNVCAIIADEAQDLPSEALRLFKTLNNLEVDDAKLVQLILVGHPAAKLRLASPGSETLGQRMFRVIELPALTPEQTADYVRHRIARAGEHPEAHVTDDALRRIHLATGGVPRAVNRLCEFALLAAYARATTDVDLPLLEAVIEENDFDEEALAAAAEPHVSPAAAALLRHEVELARRMARRLRAGRKRLDGELTRADRTSDQLRQARLSGAQQATRLTAANDTAAHHTTRLVQLEESVHARLAREQESRREAELRAQTQAAEFDRRLAEWQRRADEIGAAVDETAQRALREARVRADRMIEDAAQQVSQLLADAREKADRMLTETRRRQDRLVEEAALALTRVDDAARTLGAELAQAADRAADYRALAEAGRADAEQLTTLLARAEGAADEHRRLHDSLRAAEDRVDQTARAAADRCAQARAQTDDLHRRTEALLESLSQRESHARALSEAVERDLSALAQAETTADTLVQRHAAVILDLQRARGEALAASEETRTSTAAAHDALTRAEQAGARLEGLVRQAEENHQLTRAALEESRRIEADIRQRAATYSRAAEETAGQVAALAAGQHHIEERLETADARVRNLLADVSDRLHGAEHTLCAVQQACVESARLAENLAERHAVARELDESVAARVAHAERVALHAEDACRRVALAEQDAGRAREKLAELTAQMQTAVSAGEEKIAAAVARGESLLQTVADRLAELSAASERASAALARERDQLAENERQTIYFQQQAGAALDQLRRTLDRADQVNLDAQRRFDDQITETGAMEVRARELADRIRVDCLDAEQVALRLEQTVQQTQQAIQQPRAMLDDLAARVPELRQLSTMLHEIYFKLSSHVPDVLSPADWATLDRTAEGRLRKGLIAGAARTRQLVTAIRRLHDHTTRQISHLQDENRRAAALCRLLPQQFQAALPMLREPQRIITRLEQAIDELQGLLRTLPDAPAASAELGADETHPRRAQLLRIRRDLGERAARLSGIIREAAVADAREAAHAPQPDAAGADVRNRTAAQTQPADAESQPPQLVNVQN